MRFTAARTNGRDGESMLEEQRVEKSILGHPKTTSRILYALLLQLYTETHQGPCTDRTVARLT